MSLNCHLTFIQITFHHHPGADIRVSPPSKSCHTSNQTSTDHLHAGHISPPSKWRYKYHLHPHPIPPQPRPIDSHLNSVQVACHLNLCPDNCISPPSKWRINSFLSLQIASELHSSTITNPYRSKDVRHKSHPNWIQAPSPMPHITSIQVTRFASRCNPCHVPPPNKVLVSVSPGPIWNTPKYQNVRSPPNRSLLTYILVPRSKYHLHPCTASPPYMPKNSCLTSICVASRISQLHASPISPQIKVLRIASNLHPGHISTTPRWQDVHLTSIHIHSHLHQSPYIHILSSSRSHLICI